MAFIRPAEDSGYYDLKLPDVPNRWIVGDDVVSKCTQTSRNLSIRR